MAAVVYWTNLNSKHDLSAPEMSLRVRLVGVNKNPTQSAGYTGQLAGSGYNVRLITGLP